MLPDGLHATTDLLEAVDGAGAVVMAVPSHGFRDVFSVAAPRIAPGTPIVSLTKGIDIDSISLSGGP